MSRSEKNTGKHLLSNIHSVYKIFPFYRQTGQVMYIPAFGLGVIMEITYFMYVFTVYMHLSLK